MIKNIIDFRKKYNGLFEINAKVPVKDSYSLSLVYTPGVGKSCTEIHKDSEKSYIYTNRANSIAIISVGDKLSLIPELESKVICYKEFAGIDAYPVIIKTKDTNKITDIIENLTPNFAGFDLSAIPYELSKQIEDKLVKTLKFPVIYSHNIPDITESINKTELENTLLPETIIPALMKSAIDIRAFNINKEMIDAIYKALMESIKLNLISKNSQKDLHLQILPQIAFYAAKSAFESKNTSLNISPEEVKNNFEDFLIEGEKAFFKSSPIGYLSKNHTLDENSIELHRKAQGVIEVSTKANIKNYRDFEFFVSNDSIKKVSKQIEEDCKKAYDTTSKGNLIAIVSDGTAVLGLGNIGAEAALPVMEGKSALFKSLAGVDTAPICLKTQDPDHLIDIISNISPMFGGINLEDISSPSCFKVERTLIKTLDIPVFHDDQHGTAVVVLAGFLNALKLTEKNIKNVKVVVNGAGAGAISVSELLLQSGVKNLILCDTRGAIYQGREEGMNSFKEAISLKTNPNKEKGSLTEIMKGADFFIGLSVANIVTKEMVKSMANKPVVFALANPTPEIMPDLAKEAGAFIVATGRSDFKNQINNSLAFPGIFRGALDIRATRINNEMKVAASYAIANLINEKQLNTECIIPHALDLAVPPSVAKAVAEMGIKTNVAQKPVDPEIIYERTKNYLYDGFLRIL